MSEQRLQELEKLLYKWQVVSQACIHCGKPRGRPWTIRVVGRCPITYRSLSVTAFGETFLEMRDALLADQQIQELLGDERVKNVLDKTE